MPDIEPPPTILVFAQPASSNYDDLEPMESEGRYRDLPKLPNLQKVDVSQLHTQVNIFLQQMNLVMQDTPDKVGGFKLSEFEVSVGLVFQGEGQIGLVLIANAKVSAELNAGMKFVFKRD